MLPVAVDGDNAFELRKLLRYIGKAIFQATPFPAVHLMRQHGALLMRSSLIEPMQVLRIAAVIDDDDMLKAAFYQLLDDSFELFIWIE